MFFLYLLIALTAVAAAIFAAPLRHKVWTALALTAAGALWCSARAVGVLAGAGSAPVWSIPGTLFGGDTGSMDGLSALFVIIISVGAVAAVLYSRGYLARTLRPGETATVFIGPEGDFSPGEIAFALASGFEEITLGQQRLRTETAALAAVVMAAVVNG